VAQPFRPAVAGAPAAICRVCAMTVRLDPTSVDTLSAHVRRFMDAHHHDGGSDIVIDIHDIPDRRSPF
jgi:hypothetical protein